MSLTALHALLAGAKLLGIAPATRWRGWINATCNRFANRNLPILVANKSGWVLLNPVTFDAIWDRGDDRSAVTVESGDGPLQHSTVVSLFGHGILTWTMPYLFRPRASTCWGHGPANWPKDVLCPLEGRR